MKLNCILLVDDDEPVNFLNEIVIQKAGFAENVISALSGLDALNMLSGNTDNECPKPDLIFLDLNMPAMNGWEFIEEYSKLSNNQRDGTIIKILSSSINPDDMEQANNTEGVHGFLSKPLTAEKLQEVVTTFFS